MKEKLIGVWELVSHVHRSENGDVFHPFGDKPLGRLVYTKTGHMLVNIMLPDRPRFNSLGVNSGSADEKVAAVDGFIAYSGTFNVRGSAVYHQVDISLFPNWVGSEQERHVKFDGELLQLSSNPFKGRTGSPATAIIHWRRVSADMQAQH